jgi:hypothetical protein
MTDQPAPSPDVETVREIALSLCNCINRNMPEHGPCCPTGRLLAALRGAGHQCDHDAEAHNLAHEVDRVRERLWRLAALAGWRSGNPADNDATAELYVTEALRGAGLPEPSGPRCAALSEDGRRCHGDVGHFGTHWAGASRVWSGPPSRSALTDKEVALLRTCRTLDVIPTDALDAAMPDLIETVELIIAAREASP